MVACITTWRDHSEARHCRHLAADQQQHGNISGWMWTAGITSPNSASDTLTSFPAFEAPLDSRRPPQLLAPELTASTLSPSPRKQAKWSAAAAHGDQHERQGAAEQQVGGARRRPGSCRALPLSGCGACCKAEWVAASLYLGSPLCAPRSCLDQQTTLPAAARWMMWSVLPAHHQTSCPHHCGRMRPATSSPATLAAHTNTPASSLPAQPVATTQTSCSCRQRRLWQPCLALPAADRSQGRAAPAVAAPAATGAGAPRAWARGADGCWPCGRPCGHCVPSTGC